MSEIRYDLLTGEYVIYSPGRFRRAKNILETTNVSEKDCQLCPGKEDETPYPELFTIFSSGERLEIEWDKEKIKNQDWLLRVVPNKKAILNLEVEHLKDRGVSEVIIETPKHGPEFHELGIEELSYIFEAVAARYNDLKKDNLLKYFCFFKNSGALAGASQKHLHSQIVCMPIIPPYLNNRVQKLREEWERGSKCLFCEEIKNSLKQRRDIEMNLSFVAFCPYVSYKAFEILIAPFEHECSFARDIISSPPSFIKTHHLAEILKNSIERLQILHEGGVPYNLLLYTAPFHYDQEQYSFHWFFKIRPTLTFDAGFEWATKVGVNPVMPEDAAEQLRNVGL